MGRTAQRDTQRSRIRVGANDGSHEPDCLIALLVRILDRYFGYDGALERYSETFDFLEHHLLLLASPPPWRRTLVKTTPVHLDRE